MPGFTSVIKKFDNKGEKTGWSYIDVPSEIANQMKAGNKKAFAVKGRIDDYEFEGLNLLPMGEGNFILALNATIRKAIRKQKGAIVNVRMDADEKPYQLNNDLLKCLADDREATAVFAALPNSHKHYYSKWIDTAKTEPTKARRIAIVINGLAQHLDFGAMLRQEREEKRLLGR